MSEAFRKWADKSSWQRYVTQNRTASNYVTLSHDAVIIFEFFMPLANEADLRSSLDALFYEDSIDRRLRFADKGRLENIFPRDQDDQDDSYFKRVREWVSSKIGGYSISHVSGRFRAAELMTRAESAGKQWERYLVDETTAVVKFIFPCGTPRRDQFANATQYLDHLAEKMDDAAHDEANKVRFFFHLLFVQSIVEAVNGEDEIWLLESGMHSGLHIWRISDNVEEA